MSDKEDAKSDDKAELKERKVKIKVAKKASNILGIQVMQCALDEEGLLAPIREDYKQRHKR